MTSDASLIIQYKDGTTQELPLCDHAIELDHSGKGEIRFGETKKGWMFSYTRKSLLPKNVRSITFTNKTS